MSEAREAEEIIKPLQVDLENIIEHLHADGHNASKLEDERKKITTKRSLVGREIQALNYSHPEEAEKKEIEKDGLDKRLDEINATLILYDAAQAKIKSVAEPIQRTLLNSPGITNLYNETEKFIKDRQTIIALHEQAQVTNKQRLNEIQRNPRRGEVGDEEQCNINLEKHASALYDLKSELEEAQHLHAKLQKDFPSLGQLEKNVSMTAISNTEKTTANLSTTTTHNTEQSSPDEMDSGEEKRLSF